MLEFFQAGGWSMWFVTLFGLITLVVAIVFAVQADLGKLAFVRAMTLSTTFSIACGVLTNFLAVCRYVGGDPAIAANGELPRIVLIGFGESITPAILGFSMLAVTWLIVAVGTRRVRDLGD